ncbi:hypothetical protein, partial [Aliarcobacter cibarius]|uniref:hypothetical protein n=2 Tax=Aliarcobacter cibarius TaxID=255507 RepID=UPI0014777BB8
AYTWSYTLDGNTTHTTQGANIDGIKDEFSVTVKDSDGDTSAANTLTVTIKDDVPTVNFTDAINNTTNLTVATGTWSEAIGADNDSTTLGADVKLNWIKVNDVSIPTTTFEFDFQNSSNTGSGTFVYNGTTYNFDLTLNDNGTYKVVAASLPQTVEISYNEFSSSIKASGPTDTYIVEYQDAVTKDIYSAKIYAEVEGNSLTLVNYVNSTTTNIISSTTVGSTINVSGTGIGLSNNLLESYYKNGVYTSESLYFNPDNKTNLITLNFTGTGENSFNTGDVIYIELTGVDGTKQTILLDSVHGDFIVNSDNSLTPISNTYTGGNLSSYSVSLSNGEAIDYVRVTTGFNVTNTTSVKVAFSYSVSETVIFNEDLSMNFTATITDADNDQNSTDFDVQFNKVDLIPESTDKVFDMTLGDTRETVNTDGDSTSFNVKINVDIDDTSSIPTLDMNISDVEIVSTLNSTPVATYQDRTISNGATHTQTISLGSAYAGKEVTVSFDAKSNSNWKQGDLFRVYKGTVNSNNLVKSYNNDFNVDNYTFTVVLNSNGEATINFVSDSNADDKTVSLSDFKVLSRVESYHYTIALDAELTDNGEILSDITLDNLPVGVTIDGLTANVDGSYTIDINSSGDATVTLISSTQLDLSSLNSITASVTSKDGTDSSTITVNKDFIVSIEAGAGDDTIDYNGTEKLIDGGAGNDVLKLMNGDDIDFSNLDNSIIKNIEKIDLSSDTSANLLTKLTLSDVMDMTPQEAGITHVDTGIKSTDHILKITAGSNDMVNLIDKGLVDNTSDNWVKSNNTFTDTDNTVYNVFTSNEDSSYKVLIQNTIETTITNS